MMKAAVIGAGFIADFHAAAYRKAAWVELAAISGRDTGKASEMAARHGCAAYSDAGEMLRAEKPDLVSVCVPTHLHEEYVVMALEHGANVLCEKPLALTMDACQNMADTAQRRGRVLMTGQVLRWWPEYQRIAREIARMGPPGFLSAHRLQHASRTAWLPRPGMGGGALFDLYVHDLDFACHLFGHTPEILSACGIRGAEGAWQNLCTLLRWPNGVCAKIESSNLQPAKFPYSVYFRADYPAACLLYEFRAPLNIQRDARAEAAFSLFENGEARPLETSMNAQAEAFDNEIKAFAEGVERGRPPFDIKDTLAVMGLIHRVKDLLEEGAQAP